MTDEELNAWREWRRGGLGASDVSGVLGLSPWASPWSVWASKCLTLFDDDNESMEFGRRAEPMLADYFRDRTGLVIGGEQAWCERPGAEWMRCTVDGFVLDNETSDIRDALGVYEAKTTSASAADWAEEVPVHYQCQATWASLVTGYDHVWFGVLHLAFGRPQYRVYEFTPSVADKATVLDACTTFWRDHVLTGTPPAVDGTEATTAALAHAWDDTTPEAIEFDDVTGEAVWDLAVIKAEIKEREQTKTALENVIKAALADHETGEVDGWRITWKPQDRKTIDSAALRADHPDLADKYTTTTTSRVLRFAKPKGDT